MADCIGYEPQAVDHMAFKIIKDRHMGAEREGGGVLAGFPLIKFLFFLLLLLQACFHLEGGKRVYGLQTGKKGSSCTV